MENNEDFAEQCQNMLRASSGMNYTQINKMLQYFLEISIQDNRETVDFDGSCKSFRSLDRARCFLPTISCVFTELDVV